MNYKETYQEWLSNPYFDEDTKKELTAIENDENEIKERFYADLESEGKKVNAKSIMGMMSLGLDSGELVTVIADGPDEEVAVEDIAKYLCSGKSN